MFACYMIWFSKDKQEYAKRYYNLVNSFGHNFITQDEISESAKKALDCLGYRFDDSKEDMKRVSEDELNRERQKLIQLKKRYEYLNAERSGGMLYMKNKKADLDKIKEKIKEQEKIVNNMVIVERSTYRYILRKERL